MPVFRLQFEYQDFKSNATHCTAIIGLASDSDTTHNLIQILLFFLLLSSLNSYMRLLQFVTILLFTTQHHRISSLVHRKNNSFNHFPPGDRPKIFYLLLLSTAKHFFFFSPIYTTLHIFVPVWYWLVWFALNMSHSSINYYIFRSSNKTQYG